MIKNQWFVRKLFWKFFLPALLSCVGLAVGGIADSLYIGRTMSESGLFILGAASPVYLVFSTLSIGIAEGGAIHFASALSQGKEAEARGIFYSSITVDFLLICVISALGIVFVKPLVALLGCTPDMEVYGSMLDYVRLMLVTSPILFMQAPLQYFVHTDSAPKLASTALIVGNICDCAFGFLFIVVFGLGVRGSVYATVCGAVIMECICLSHLVRGNGALRLMKIVVPSIKKAMKSLRTGFASAAQFIYDFIIILAFNRVLLSMSGEAAVAIFDITVNSSALVTAVVDAVVLAMIPLVSTFFGERNHAGMRGSLKVSLIAGTGLTAAGAGLMIIFAGWYCGFSGLSSIFIGDGAYFMRAFMISTVLACVNTVFAAYFQNIGLEKWSYAIMALRGLVVLLPAGILFSTGGYRLFCLCFIATEALVLALVVCLWIYVGRTGRDGSRSFAGSTIFSESFIGSCEQISDTCERLQGFLEENGEDVREAYFITLAVDETIRLIAENGEELMLQLTLVKEDERYTLHIRDNACRFNPFDVSDEDESGLGLKIVKKQATDFYYRQFVGFNTLTVVFGGD